MKIDLDVPLPPVNTSKGYSKYPIANLSVGASFFVPATQFKTVRSLRVYLAGRARLLNMQLAFRDRTEDGQPGIRIWRIK